MTDYNLWKETEPNYKKYNVKYYKGLGTSNSNEAKEYFKALKLNTYVSPEKEKTDYSINLAFNKKQADDRKDWLKEFDENNILDYNEPKTVIEDFVNKELIHFSNADTSRLLVLVLMDLDKSKKIPYSCLKRNFILKLELINLQDLSSCCLSS